MKKLFGVFIFALLFASASVLADKEEGSVSVISIEPDCTEVSLKLEKAILDVERMHHEAAVAHRDAVHIYGIIGALLVICLLLFAGFRGRGRRIEELENEIITERIALGSRIPRECDSKEEGTPC